jgi:protein required for attachment to host cells
MIMNTVDWILVADRSRALILHALPQNLGPYPTLASFAHPEGRLRSQDRDSDTSGRVSLPGGIRSTVEPHEDSWHVEARRFAKDLADVLQNDRQNGRFDRLFVVAPPAFLGVLREALPGTVRKTIAAEIAEELLSLPAAEWQSRLEKMVAEHQDVAGAPR